MNFDTKTAADYAGQKLDSLLERATRDSAAVIEQKNIPAAVASFADLRDTYRSLSAKMAQLRAHVDLLSQEQIPTMFMNQSTKTISVEGVGRVSINDRWSASMIVKEDGFKWLRSTGNGGMIQETVNAQTLGAFAKDEAAAQRPLPGEIFKVSSTPYVSITR